MREGVPQKQGTDNPAFTTLATPTECEKIMLFEKLDQLNLIAGGFKSHYLSEKLDGILAQLPSSFNLSPVNYLFALLKTIPLG
jgi:hypothetical protein